MNTRPAPPIAPRLVGKRRLFGIALVAALYAFQWFVSLALLARLQQSVLGILIVSAILILGWLTGGLTLGSLVIDRADGRKHYWMGLIVALFASFCLVAAGLNHLSNLPSTYCVP